MFNSTRFNNTRRSLWAALTLGMMLVLAGCGGTSAAPLSGVDALPTITISVSPTTSTVPTGMTQTFTATVNNTTATSVSWLVNGLTGGAFKDPTTGLTSYPSGQISSKGVYTAPQYVPVPAAVTITAASNANNTITANATATITGAIQPGGVTISPTSATIYVNQVVALNASVSNGAPNPIVTYSVNDEVGGSLLNGTVSLVAGSLTDALYTAPTVAPSEPVNVTASYLDPTTNLTQSASTLVTVLPLPANAATVAITPPIATVEATQPLTLTANVTGGGITDSPVSWSVNGEPNGNATAGTIKSFSNTTATYTAPQTVPAPNSVVITATATEASYASASALVTIATFIPPVVNVTAPSFPQGNASAVAGGTLTVDATVTNGPTNATLSWSVSQPSGCNDPGSVTNTPPGTQETYTAPSTEPTGSCDLVTVTATLEGSDPPVVGNLPVLITAQPVVNITLNPSTPQMVQAGGLGVPFTATVTGTSNTTVEWKVNGEVGGDSTIGTIVPGVPVNGMPTATYLSPATVPNPNTVDVTAVWTGDNKTSSAPTAITITPEQFVSIQVSPSSADVMVSQTQQFSATVSGTTDYTVYWSVSGANCGTGGCGTIFPTTTTMQGQLTTYTAPATVPPVNTVTITAKADAAPNPTSTATVTVEPNATPTIAISPNPGYTEPAGTGGNFGFMTVITNAPNTTEVTWTMGCNSLSDGDSGETCHDSDFDGDGPGCISLNGFTSCTGGESLGGAGNLTLEYTFPRTLGTVFTPNSCEPTQNGSNGQVPMTVTMSVSGCTLTSCTATVCITIEP
jgi:hypothetical protein